MDAFLPVKTVFALVNRYWWYANTGAYQNSSRILYVDESFP